MNEHESNAPGIPAEDPQIMRNGGAESAPRPRDLVVDLTHLDKLDLTSLALLLTAQRQARTEDRDTWLAGVPMHVWEALHGMGLGRFFKPFPTSGPTAE